MREIFYSFKTQNIYFNNKLENLKVTKSKKENFGVSEGGGEGDDGGDGASEGVSEGVSEGGIKGTNMNKNDL